MNQYQGLSSKEVLESRAKYGMNMMEKKNTNLRQMILMVKIAQL